MSGLLSAVFQPIRLLRQSFHGISAVTSTTSKLVQPESTILMTVRNKVRCYFPRPNEVRRVRRHGWQARMATNTGRRVIMRRILKGKFVLTH